MAQPLKVKLNRNLRRTVLRGHPWVYREAVTPIGNIERAALAKVFDIKGDLGWAIFDPHGPLALRFLTTDKVAPTEAFFIERFDRAYALRSAVRSEQTNAYRLFNGEGDLLPGLVCDVYDFIAVVQFDGQGPSEFWDRDLVANWLLSKPEIKSVVEKSRRKNERNTKRLGGIGPDESGTASPDTLIRENGAIFNVSIEKGQKTGFFLDQRENRHYVRGISKGKSVLNLFSYTGGFSIYAGLGGAKRVASLDIAEGAIAHAEENWILNGLDPKNHIGICVDVFEYLNSDGEEWDHILVDPPSMSHSEDQLAIAKAKYIEVFAAAAKRVVRGGQLSLSSCSSHVTFEDFFKIVDEALSLCRRTGQILRVSGQGMDHPFPHACPELRYLKFVHLQLN